MTERAAAPHPGRGRTRVRAGASKLVALSALAIAAGILGVGGPTASTRSAVPPEPKLCRAPVPANGVTKEGTIEYRDALCGSRGRDKFRTRGGGDAVWGYQGDDVIKARDGMADEIWGGPGRDTAEVDPCDEVHGVEQVAMGPPCPDVDPQGQRYFQAEDVLPYGQPVVECWTAEDGSRRMGYLFEPQMRALDATANVDFQTVAWQTVVLKQNADRWEWYGEGNWYWDRTYDLQVRPFPGNFWRSFTAGRRTFVTYIVDGPGVYAVGVNYHWYKTAKAPERETVDVARAHYGPNEAEGHDACEFPT
ncbi:MAG: hypothetical protein ACRDN6_03635 [Gaiellaceae bacterium]